MTEMTDEDRLETWLSARQPPPAGGDLVRFVAESNRIENIHRAPTGDEMRAHLEFLALDRVTVDDMRAFVAVAAPGHRLRDRPALDVVVGVHRPPNGGPAVRTHLEDLLERVNERAMTPWEAHCEYEYLHPFTDGNGRSGRALWLWMRRGDAPLGFLHHYYYETLGEIGGEVLPDLARKVAAIHGRARGEA